MLDGQVALLTLAAARYFALGEVPPRLGTEHPGRVPSASFRCADGSYVHITASDQHWLPLCQALGLEEWGSEAELQSNSGRRASGATRSWRGSPRRIAARRRDEHRRRARRGRRAGRAGPRRRRDPDRPARARAPAGRKLRLSDRGRIQGACAAATSSSAGTNPPIGRPPLLGEHTESVLSERLGLSRERIAQLKEAKAI